MKITSKQLYFLILLAHDFVLSFEPNLMMYICFNQHFLHYQIGTLVKKKFYFPFNILLQTLISASPNETFLVRIFLNDVIKNKEKNSLSPYHHHTSTYSSFVKYQFNSREQKLKSL